MTNKDDGGPSPDMFLTITEVGMLDGAPVRIWLNDDGNYDHARDAVEGVTWCWHPIDDDDTEYLRADMHTAALAARDARIAALEAGLRKASTALDWTSNQMKGKCSGSTVSLTANAASAARALLDGGKA
jgi:hypothetical protein